MKVFIVNKDEKFFGCFETERKAQACIRVESYLADKRGEDAEWTYREVEVA
jgi:hypothetical protein